MDVRGSGVYGRRVRFKGILVDHVTPSRARIGVRWRTFVYRGMERLSDAFPVFEENAYAGVGDLPIRFDATVSLEYSRILLWGFDVDRTRAFIVLLYAKNDIDEHGRRWFKRLIKGVSMNKFLKRIVSVGSAVCMVVSLATGCDFNFNFPNHKCCLPHF